MRLSILAGVTATAILLSASLSLHAEEVITFSYTSTSSPYSDTSSTGTGSFSFAGSPATLTAADLESFNFTDTFDSYGSNSDFTFSLADLTSFSATISDGILETLSLTTGSVDPTELCSSAGAESFTITSLAPGGASTTSYSGEPYNIVAPETAGDITIDSETTVTPERSSFVLLGTGLLGVVGMVRRRFAPHAVA